MATPSSEFEIASNRRTGADVQHIVIGVHGTNNGPQNVRQVTEQIGTALSNNPHGSMFIDTSFDWSKQAGTFNQPGGREKVGDRLAQHLDTLLTKMKQDGTLDVNKPIELTGVGFSHGGNVINGASDEIAAVLKKHGVHDNTTIHTVTVSTPAYNNGGPEDPRSARRDYDAAGIANLHTHFATRGDGVIRGAMANAYYYGPGHPESGRRDDGGVFNYTLPGKGLNGVASHGAAQDDPEIGGKAADIVRARSLDYQNRQGRPRPNGRLSDGIDDDGISIAAVSANAERDPLVQQIRGAIDARTAKGEALHVGSSEIAALATAAHREGFDKVGDVVRGKDGQLFAVDHAQADNPAARFVRADAAVAALPPAAAWQKLGEVQAATTPTLAQAPADVETQARGPRVA